MTGPTHSHVAISSQSGTSYPEDGGYSPAERFPEYRFGGPLSASNDVYGLVRRCLQEFGCDGARFGSESWNPLGEWIKEGDRVVVLTNFVVHRRPWESIQQFRAKCTHASVIRAVLDYAAIASGDPHRVSFGNAPLQSCDYAKVTSETGAMQMAAFYDRVTGADVGPHDLRLLRSRWTNFGAQVDVEELDPENAIAIDLAEASWLEPLFVGEADTQVRVGDYPASETMAFHDQGKHVYVLNKRVLEADVIISVPKLKTHEKVGITCALKGTVGAIARKECLAHHRPGGGDDGGDEYPRAGFLRDLSSKMSERACDLGTDPRSNAYRVSAKILNRALRLGRGGVTYGAWHGNDTAWRMALDIARILRFGTLDGAMAKQPTRRHLALVDGVVAGEGEGPLSPEARELGAVLFAPDPCTVDAACAYAMGFDPRRLKLVAKAFEAVGSPLTDAHLDDVRYRLNGAEVAPAGLAAAFAPGFRAPKGWAGRMEYGG